MLSIRFQVTFLPIYYCKGNKILSCELYDRKILNLLNQYFSQRHQFKNNVNLSYINGMTGIQLVKYSKISPENVLNLSSLQLIRIPERYYVMICYQSFISKK